MIYRARMMALAAASLAACGSPSGDPDASRRDGGGGQAGDAGDSGDSAVRLTVLSGRADMVTAGDALVALEGADADASDVTITLEGADVSDSFHQFDGKWIARLEGLPLGESTLAVSAGEATDELTLDNHPQEGPVFSGPHQEPFFCTTEQYLFSPPLDDACNAPTITSYWYRSTEGSFLQLEDPTELPDDVAQTTLDDGRTVDFVVQIEAGTRNRAIYWIATLYAPGEDAWEPWSPHSTWNRKLIYAFGGGCGVGYHQGDPLYTLAFGNEPLLGRGFAVAHASLNTLGQNCNDVVSAETAMMVKEHFITRYGEPIYTMGGGGSGGAIQQHLIVENYPGILDGILPTLSYPDIITVLPEVMDCRLLRAYFGGEGAGTFDGADRTAVMGYASEATCAGWDNLLGLIFDPSEGCDEARVEPGAIYDPDTNPDGARCTFQDHSRNLLGVDPRTGFALNPFDNRGIQYGLEALESGAISADQFLDLNEAIGGIDDEGEIVPERSVADEDAVRAAYAGGRVLDGGYGLGEVPIIDLRNYLDPAGDIHDAFRTDSVRARLVTSRGNADNHVAFITGAEPGSSAEDAFEALDAWLVAFVADEDPDRAAAVRNARPAGLVDRCYGADGPVDGDCANELPRHSSPRRVAGAPIANDVLQCALVDVDPDAYAVSFTDAQRARLDEVFPDGVCDWEAAPPARVPHEGTWQRFGD